MCTWAQKIFKSRPFWGDLEIDRGARGCDTYLIAPREGGPIEGMMIMAKSTKTAFTAATLATELGTDPRTARKFFRSAESGIEPVGKGARYSLEFTATQLNGLKKKFTAWTEAAAAKKAEISDAEAKKINVLTVKAESAPVETDDEPEAADLTDEEFTQMIEEIEAEGEVEA